MVPCLATWSSSCGIYVSLVSRFPWSLSLTWSAVHSYMPPWSLVSPVPCLGSSIMLACASVVSWSHMWGHMYACMISYGSACVPSLCVSVSCIYLSGPGHLHLILVLLYSLLCIGFVEHFMCTLMISYAMYLDTYFKKVCTECHSYALIVCLH